MILLWLTGCIALEGGWFQPVVTDTYELPGNDVPDDLVEDLTLTGTAIDGEPAPTLCAVWAHQPGGDAQPLLYLHGSGGNIDAYWDRVQILWRQGHPVLALDYRGYGCSTGTPSEDGLYADAETGLQAVQARYPDRPILAYGYSLGGAVAVELAARRHLDGILLEAAVGGAQVLTDLGAGLAFPAQAITDAGFDSVDRIPDVTEPVLVVHGTHDTIVPPEVGELLRDRAPDSTWVPIEAGHGDVPCPGAPSPCTGDPVYLDPIADWTTVTLP